MPIQRTLEYLLNKLYDAGTNVTAKDMADMLVSLQMVHGQIYQRHNAAPTVITDTTNFFECTFSGTTLTTDVSHYFDSPASGRLRYTGPNAHVLHIACTISFTGSTANESFEFRLGKNGVSSEQNEVDSFVSVPSDVQSTALHWVVKVNQYDYISLFAKNDDGAHNITVSHLNLQAVGMIA